MTSQIMPKILFVGAGNIAQSILKGIIKAQPSSAKQILATAPTRNNLDVIEKLGCQVSLLSDINGKLAEFKPEIIFICIKPQVLLHSISKRDALLQLLSSVPHKCIMISLLAGIKSQILATTLNQPERNIVRVMLNTAAELQATSVFYHPHVDLEPNNEKKLNDLFQMIGHPIVKLVDENLMDVATGLCGSGIALFYEMIQAMSDAGVKNGLMRDKSTQVAAQLCKAAGEMLLSKQVHPYQARDQVTSAAGTTIYGLDKWHEQSINHRIKQAVQASIDRSKSLSMASEEQIMDIVD
jgi:pyrroline-5-carboxylate reductase